LSLPPDSRAARTSQSAGWTVPRDYTPVHELFKALRVGPYKDLGKVSFVDVVRHYWPWILVLILAMALMVANILYIRRLNRYLKEVTLSLEKSNIELQRLSTQDGLTGVANHRLFEETLAREWARAARERAPLSIVMIDIDHFKLLNDSDGHLAGDDCLKRVAQALNQAVRRPADFLARYGGEEFIAILPGTDMDGATMVAERLREAVEDSHLVNRGTGRFVTVSLGVASAVPSPGTSGEVLVATADRAMYQAKEAGRNQVRRAA